MDTLLIGQAFEPPTPGSMGCVYPCPSLGREDDLARASISTYAIPFEAGGMFGRFSAVLENLATGARAGPTARPEPASQASMDQRPSASAPTASPIPVATLDHLALHSAIAMAPGTRARRVETPPPAQQPTASVVPHKHPVSETSKPAFREHTPCGSAEHAEKPQPHETDAPQARLRVDLGDGTNLVVQVSSSTLSDDDLRRLHREARRIASDAGLVLDKLSVNGQDHIKPYVVHAKDLAWHWHR